MITERKKFLGPMLAATLWDSKSGKLKRKLDYPVVASPKIDGQRGCCINAEPLTRSGKSYRNNYVRLNLSGSELDGLDGEIVVGDPFDPMIFKKTRKAIAGAGGFPDFHFWVFDDFESSPKMGKWDRYLKVKERVEKLCQEQPRFARHIRIVEHVLINNEKDLLEYISEQLLLGYEGVMVSSRDGEYIFKRSTLTEGILMKVKPYDFEEGEIVGFEEEFENLNESFIDELGRKKKSDTKDAKASTGRLANFICKSPKWNGTFKVSATSISHKMKARIWSTRGDYIGDFVRFKHFAHGAQEKPRHAIFDEFRDKDDMSF